MYTGRDYYLHCSVRCSCAQTGLQVVRTVIYGVYQGNLLYFQENVPLIKLHAYNQRHLQKIMMGYIVNSERYHTFTDYRILIKMKRNL